MFNLIVFFFAASGHKVLHIPAVHHCLSLLPYLATISGELLRHRVILNVNENDVKMSAYPAGLYSYCQNHESAVDGSESVSRRIGPLPLFSDG